MPPNTIEKPTGAATISWRSQGVDEVEVRIGSPSGLLFARSGSGDHTKTASWISSSTVFYLQDVSGGKTLSADHTLATIEVTLRLSRKLMLAARTRRVWERLRYKRIIEEMVLGTNTACQYDCVLCSHAEIRHQEPGYQLSLEDLREFIRLTEASGYLIRTVTMTGPGDVLLWKDLRQGLKLLRNSPSIQKIYLVTNGIGLDRIDNETWDNINHLGVSLYPAFKKHDTLAAVQSLHPDKVTVRKVEQFYSAPPPMSKIPCNCHCSGPMYYDRKIFFYCGPVVFGAASAKGVSVYDYPEMFTEVGLDYLDKSVTPPAGIERIPVLNRIVAKLDRKEKTGDHELCRFCWGNSNGKREFQDHVAFPILISSGTNRSVQSNELASANRPSVSA